MVDTVTEQIQREAPEIEAFRLGLLESAKELTDQAVPLPDYQVSGLGDLATIANQLALSGVGSYQPFLNRAGETTALGTGTLSEGVQTTRGGLGQLGLGAQGIAGGFTPISAGELATTGALGTMAGGIQGLDPQAYQAFFNPFTTEVIEQAEKDITRQGDIQRTALGSQAAQAGAFGGSRHGIQETELGRNILDQQARTAAQLRLAGFGQAQQLAQQRAQQLGQLGLGQLRGAQNLGQLGQLRGLLGSQLGQIGSATVGAGQAQGQLGQALGQLGQVQGQLGEAQSKLQAQDLQNLSTLGLTQRQQNQALLDAQRQNILQRQFEPYQRVSWLQDILSRTPTAQQTLTTASSPGVSPFQQAAGLGIAGLSAAAGAKNLNLF